MSIATKCTCGMSPSSFCLSGVKECKQFPEEMEMTIWQCHNPECNAQYSEYVNGCPKCCTGEPGGSHKVSILDEYHPAYMPLYKSASNMEKKHPIGEHLQPIPESLGAFIMAQPGLTPLVTANGYYWHYKDVITLLTRYKEQTPTGAVWVKASDSIKDGEYVAKFKPAGINLKHDYVGMAFVEGGYVRFSCPDRYDITWAKGHEELQYLQLLDESAGEKEMDLDELWDKFSEATDSGTSVMTKEGFKKMMGEMG